MRADDQALYYNTTNIIHSGPRGQIIFPLKIIGFFQYHDNDWVGLQPHVAAVLKSLI